jgi:hypothetical protein
MRAASGCQVFKVGVAIAQATAPSAAGPVLILQTEQGFWGIPIDRTGMDIIATPPIPHEPRTGGSGFVTVGTVHHGGKDHALPAKPGDANLGELHQ